MATSAHLAAYWLTTDLPIANCQMFCADQIYHIIYQYHFSTSSAVIQLQTSVLKCVCHIVDPPCCHQPATINWPMNSPLGVLVPCKTVCSTLHLSMRRVTATCIRSLWQTSSPPSHMHMHFGCSPRTLAGLNAIAGTQGYARLRECPAVAAQFSCGGFSFKCRLLSCQSLIHSCGVGLQLLCACAIFQ